jgi:hypothetical protein
VIGAGTAGLSLRDGMTLSGMSYVELWVRCVGLGGCAPTDDLADQITQDESPATALDAYEHNIIAQALNEHFLDLGQDHPVGYREFSADV